MRIRTHLGLCDGHGVCTRFAPSVYRLDGEGYLDLHLLEVPPELEAAAVWGAAACPAGVITIIPGPDDGVATCPTAATGATPVDLPGVSSTR